MAQRSSGYEKKEADYYPTPAWVLQALAEVVPLQGRTIWEPACGEGQAAEAMIALGAAVCSTDLFQYQYAKQQSQFDFLSNAACPHLLHYDGIITNPPYGEKCEVAEEFIRVGLDRIADYGFLALLLPVDFDSASTRNIYFDDNPLFAGKIVLTKRIKWFDEPVPCKPCGATGLVDGVKCKPCGGKGKKKVSPSNNHAWFLWQRTWIRETQQRRTWYAPTARAA